MAELKLHTPVEAGSCKFRLSFDDRILILGSCFADNVGKAASERGFDVCANPFGTLYNPVSLCNSVARLASGMPFTEDECVRMGAGSGLYCSFSHHTSFARATAGEFLSAANAALDAASRFWKQADKVILTLGTAWCFEHLETGEVVSNCLKRDAKEFRRRRLSVKETATLLKMLVSRHPGKDFLLTVSPIRHLKDGAHGNQLSKSTLLLAIEEVLAAFPERTDYFPAYEIVLDELRDYRFYSEDLVHPSSLCVDYLWRRFVDFAVEPGDLPRLADNEKAFRRSQHRPLH